jgi:regulator of sigma E protease
VALAVLAISLLIVVHEFGHFLAAKLVGMRVEVFAIGFWKKLFGFTIGETEYRLCLVPLGGYVKVSGESPEQDAGKPHEYWSKSPGQRALFILGGVTMNFVLALVLFVIAFAIGVPFTTAEVGQTWKGEPAWQAGLKHGDRIVAIGDKQDPVFEDVARAVALGSKRQVELTVERDGRRMTFNLTPRYGEQVGMKLIGIVPPIEPVVSGLYKIGGEDGVSPAREAGIELGDRILAVNGKPVDGRYELIMELTNFPNDEVKLLIERDGETFPLSVVTQPAPVLAIGISGLGTTVESLEGDGPAQRLGLRAGDRVLAVNGTPVQSVLQLQQVVRESLGEVAVDVVRDAEEHRLRGPIADLKALERFLDSVMFESGTTLSWVREGGPAWEVGMRAGDSIVSVAGNEVKTWEEVIIEGAKVAEEEHQIQWARDGETLSAQVKAVEDTSFSGGQIGIILEKQKKSLVRYGALGAIRTSLANTYRTLADFVLMVRGFARRDVSPRQMGGIVLIGQASYHAARQGMGMLLYMTAVISAALTFINILPIPVLDGGHLLFLAIEKLRGRRLGERVLTIAQTIGFVLLILLVIYVTRNDIARLIQLR